MVRGLSPCGGLRVAGKLSISVKSIIVGALGGLLFGFDTAVIAGTTHQLTQVFSLSPGELGLHRFDRAGRHHHRRHVLRNSRRPPRRPREPAHPCNLLRNFRPRLRVRLELAFAARLPLHRRTRHRRLFSARPCLYRRDRSREVARHAGRLVPDQHRHRHSGRLLVQLHHRALRPRHQRVALDARRRSPSRRLVPHHAVRHPAQCPLAGHQESHRRSTRGA